MDVRALPDFGRPRGFSIFAAVDLPKISGRTSCALRARLKVSSLQAGFSRSAFAGLRLRFISFHLALVRFTKADDVCLAGARSEHQHMQPAVNYAQRLESALAIVSSRILGDQRRVPFKYRRAFKRNSARGDIPLVLSGVKADSHALLYIRIYGNATRPHFYNCDASKLPVMNVSTGSGVTVAGWIEALTYCAWRAPAG